MAAKPKRLSDEQIVQLGDRLIDTSNNIYMVSRTMFGIEATDADFVRLRKTGKMFRCEECSRWWPVSLVRAIRLAEYTILESLDPVLV